MELLFSVLGSLFALGVYYFGKSRGHETVVTKTLLVQDTEYQTYRVELLGRDNQTLQEQIVYSLSPPSVRVSQGYMYIDEQFYSLGTFFYYWDIKAVRITKLEGK